MKKFLFLLMASFCMACPNAYAGCNAPTTLSYDGNQHYNDDEFLYDAANYEFVKQGYENTKNKTSGDGKGYECDKFNSKSCQDGNRLTLPAGHYFRGNRIDVKTTYECKARAAGNDKWEPISKDVCETAQYGTIEVGKQYGRHLTKQECSGYPLTDDNGTEYALICRDGPTLVCKAMKCKTGMKANNGKCEIDGSSDVTCKSQRESAEGKACCDLPPEVAEWKNQQCICAGGKEFKINNGRGTCVVPENDDVPFHCPDVDISLFNQWTVQCASASHSATISLITQIQTFCNSSSLTAAEYNKLYTQVETSVTLYCKQTEPPVIDSNSKNKIIAAGKVLDGIVAGFDVSVWKNAQGEFNTARLASDSIAGVVLGTAGGLITSSVMKKKQAEQGFEDLKCVVGGQSVAGWGDEFNVGIQ